MSEPTQKLRERRLAPEEVELPAGYRIEPVLTGLSYPTSVAWDDGGDMFVAESTVPFGQVAAGEIRILRHSGHGAAQTVAGGFRRLINDLAFHDGRLYISQLGCISVLENGHARDLIAGLPSWGLHQNNALAFGPDGRLYFGQGTVSNAGVIDSYALNQLRAAGHLGDCDTPGAAVTLAGRNYEVGDLQTGEVRTTGAFSSWGVATTPGQRIPGPANGQAANGAIMSANSDGSDLRVFAWGFRNPYGLAFGPDGSLYVANNGANRIPPRQVSADPDTLWAAEEGTWYGWPDFYAGHPVTDPAFRPPDGSSHEFLLADHDELLRGRPRPPEPIVSLGLHAAPTKFDLSRSRSFGWVGQAFLAEFGALLTPVEGLRPLPSLGHRVVRIDLARRTVADLAVNRSGRPASMSDRGGGLERPIQARFGPDGNLYIVDLGELTLHSDGWHAPGGDGVVWRISAGQR